MQELDNRIINPIVRSETSIANSTPYWDRGWLTPRTCWVDRTSLGSRVECYSLSIDSLARLWAIKGNIYTYTFPHSIRSVPKYSNIYQPSPLIAATTDGKSLLYCRAETVKKSLGLPGKWRAKHTRKDLYWCFFVIWSTSLQSKRNFGRVIWTFWIGRWLT